MRESASTDLREPQGSNPLGPPGPEHAGTCLRAGPEIGMVSPEYAALAGACRRCWKSSRGSRLRMWFCPRRRARPCDCDASSGPTAPRRYSFSTWAWNFPTGFESRKGSPICSANFSRRVAGNEGISLFLELYLRKLG